jgi:23S rRNA (cytidine1920-2'-O)/16S rRNA (cytidine1409-2'-O)-methyltransferase
MTAMPQRLDKEMVARGLVPSRERAQILIRAGLVLVEGQPAEKPSQPVKESDAITVIGEVLPYVGRGGIKMEAALRHFRLNVRGAVCLDVGASTGGFTDCLLQHGAVHVIAVDVGHHQLAPSLRSDPRVEVREGVNARYLAPDQFEQPFDLAAIDVSFISLTLILPAVVPLVRPGGHVLALIKPEFEVGRGAVGTRGIVRSPEARQRAVEKVMRFATEELGLEQCGVMEVPRLEEGNREYMACFRRMPAV